MLDYAKLLKECLKEGLDEVQIYETTSQGQSIEYFNGNVETNQENKVKAISVSGILNGKKAVYNIENLDMDIKDVANNLYNNAKNVTSEEVSELFAGSSEYPSVDNSKADFHEVSTQDKIKLLADVERMLKEKDKRIVQVPLIAYEEEVSSVRIFNSKGLDISKKQEFCYLVAEVVAVDGEAPQVGFKVQVKKNFKDLDAKKIVDECADRCLSMLNAKPIPSAELETIIETDAMSNLLSAFSSMFGGESHLKKISPLQGKLGEKIFSEKLDIIDAPLHKDSLFKIPFDDEGVACYDKNVIEKGVYKTMLHNLKTAKAFNATSTGNGFHGSVSPANLYVAPGKLTKDELIASVKEGVMLTALDGLHAGLNPISGDFSLKASGFYIKDGKIEKPITLVVVTGNFLKMMNDIKEIGNDLEFSYTGVTSPSILFNKLSISGM